MKKGIIITLDAFFSLGIFLILLSYLFTINLKLPQYSNLHITSFSLSMLTAFEKSNLFSNSLEQPALLRNALNFLPYQYCAQITIFNASSKEVIIDVIRDDCYSSFNYHVFYRSFYSKNQLYIAKATVWYR